MRFEINLIRQNEALYLQNKINCAEVMKTIEAQFGPFDPNEIQLYIDSILNKIQYVELIIAAKKILKSRNMLVLPYIISGKVEKLVTRKCVNKKEKAFVEASPTYPLLLAKYKDENITMQILGIIATIISSEFSIVDMDSSIHGKRLDTIATNVIVEEVESYILLC